MPDLPADAITAAAQVIHGASCTCNDYEAHIIKPVSGDWPLRVARLALEAAAPALRAQGAAAERARLRKLAAECRTCGDVHLGYLLRGSDGHAYAPRFCSPDSTLMRRLADLLDGGTDDR